MMYVESGTFEFGINNTIWNKNWEGDGFKILNRLGYKCHKGSKHDMITKNHREGRL